MADNQNMDKPLDMSLLELFNGVALVIDDCIDKKKNKKGEDDKIHRILNQLSELYIPYVTEATLPCKEKRKHYTGISFVILDWNLQTLYLDEGVSSPETLTTDMENENISFIEDIQSQCYCPIFIFTNNTVNDVSDKLKKKGIQCDDKSNIFIKNKDEFTDNNSVVSVIVEWLRSHSSMYVLKEWEREYQKATCQLFKDFQSYHTDWAKVLWMHLGSDGGNKSIDLGEIINKNLLSRMSPFKFKDEYLISDDSQWNIDEIRGVIQAEKFINQLQLSDDIIGTGDFFEYDDPSDKQKHYLLNIRAQCDLMDRSANQKGECQKEVKENGKIEIIKNEGDPKDKIVLYCIEGKIIPDEKHNDFFDKKSHQVKQCPSRCIITCLYNKQDFVFLFKNFRLLEWEKLKSYRKGRLLPPYITYIQQHFASYIHRQGLPIDPKSIFEKPQ